MKQDFLKPDIKTLCLKKPQNHTKTQLLTYKTIAIQTGLLTRNQIAGFPEELSTYFHHQKRNKPLWKQMLVSAFTLSPSKCPLSTRHQFRTNASSLSFPLITKQLAVPTELYIFNCHKNISRNICSVSVFSGFLFNTFNWEWLCPGNFLKIIFTSLSHNGWAVKLETL